MIGILITNIICLVLLFGLVTALFILYMTERKDFRKKETEMQQQVNYYISELKKRSKDDVEM